MFSQIIKFIRILSSETSPLQISAGFALAMVIGFTPLLSVHNVLVLLVLLMFRINLAAFLLSWGLFSAIAYLLDPAFHNVGLAVLNNPELSSIWTDMYNSSLWRLTGFNNTIVMGSLTVSLIAFIPMLIIGSLFIKYFRTVILEKINNSRLFNIIKSNKWFSRFVAVVE
jgi:uncharacterized protein (TIGR03546 family)